MEDLIKYIYCLRLDRKYKYFDSSITKNLREGRIETRPVDSNGLWCPALLPTVLVLYSCLYEVSPLYKLTTFVSVGLFAYCLLFILFLSVSCDVLKQPEYGGCTASGLVSSLLLYAYLDTDLTYSIGIALPTIYFFSWLLRNSVMKCCKTFTVGEAMVVAQGIALFTMMSVAKFFCNFPCDDEEFEFISVIVYTILSTVGLIVTALFSLPDAQRNIQYLGYIVASGVVFILLLLHSLLGMSCMLKIVKYVFFEEDRATIFVFWLVLVMLAVMALLFRTKLAVKATTVTRKSFHVLASGVFLSGMIFDIHLMTFAAGFGLGVLIFVETLRKSRIEPISSALQSAFLIYSDEKDCGLFAMTPLYLYVGLACPLILVPTHVGQELELLSGVLSIGVGDTAASWFGSKYGFNKWSSSNKTYEGTLFNILCQVGTVYALQIFGLLNVNNGMRRTMIAATVSGLVEANTEQVDNLILPLVTMIAFQLTWFMC
ncbi:dolichol kinase [Epargyreus clarus]|uniref:dolichol kinase n=1 Tax=Epargyreus clarus TaxID=520877 RepID=UPI003C2E1B31